MRCSTPYVGKFGVHGCGQCMPCRVNRQRLWYHRILLEAMCHEASAFTTLTYSSESCPVDGSVRPAALTLWFKRLRKRLSPVRFRYFAVGEYGDQSWRPHYHAVLFGLGCQSGPISSDGRSCLCFLCSAVRETWPFGHTMTALLTLERARYIAKYTIKRMTHGSDERLLGRHPEFARMSRFPGLGANAMALVASAVLKHKIDRSRVTSVRHGSKILPLGRYLNAKLDEAAGQAAPKADPMQLLRSFAFDAGRPVLSVYSEVFPRENSQALLTSRSKCVI